MEAHMIRKDRPLGRVSVSFEANRFGPRHLVEVYAQLVPILRRSRMQTSEPEPSQPIRQAMKTRGGGHE
jgi:hypothetical protein